MPMRIREETSSSSEEYDEMDEMMSEGEDTMTILTQLTIPQRRTVYALKANYKAIQDLRNEYNRKIREIEMKCDECCRAPYEERGRIVMGDEKPSDDLILRGKALLEVDESVEENTAQEDTSVAKGIPNFWINALISSDVLREYIQDKDKPALEYLENVSVCYLEKNPEKGFELHFGFRPNPFFKNVKLTKTYYKELEDGESVLSNSKGTKIDWLDRSTNLTVQIKKKTQRHKTKKTTRVVEKEEKCDSFFNFFDPPRIPQEDDMIDSDEDISDDEYEQLETEIDYDYDLGSEIKNNIIPHAVDYFTGRRCQFTDDGTVIFRPDDAASLPKFDPSKDTSNDKEGAPEKECKQQ